MVDPFRAVGLHSVVISLAMRTTGRSVTDTVHQFSTDFSSSGSYGHGMPCPYRSGEKFELEAVRNLLAVLM